MKHKLAIRRRHYVYWMLGNLNADYGLMKHDPKIAACQLGPEGKYRKAACAQVPGACHSNASQAAIQCPCAACYSFGTVCSSRAAGHLDVSAVDSCRVMVDWPMHPYRPLCISLMSSCIDDVKLHG